MEVPVTWVEGLTLALVGLISYIYRQDKEDMKVQMKEFANSVQSHHDTMANMSVTIAVHQQKFQHLEKQFDEIFSLLRQIIEKLDGKQDKVH